MKVDTAEVVERIWARDATLWTGGDERSSLGWLDEPRRMQERLPELDALAGSVRAAGFSDVVLAGMGGSSLAPDVLRRTFASERLHVLDTTHPRAVRAFEEAVDLDSALFLVASKSGTTLETRCHLDYLWERVGGRGEAFVAVTDPGSPLEELGRERGFRAVIAGEPTVGGRFSALSVFGLVPAALMGVDVSRLLLRAEEMVEACRLEEGNPGLELGERLGEGWRAGRDKLAVPNPGGFGTWLEQLIAESLGKDGKGIVPLPGESGDGPDRMWEGFRITDPYELGQEFYRWEFATALAGAIMGVNPFDQPDVQAAKDRTSAILARDEEPALAPEGLLDDLLAQAGEGDYVAILAFVAPAGEERLAPLVARARETGCPVTVGLGPRYLHSTGQLHKGGPNTGLFVQVVDDLGDELPVPGRPFGFRRLVAAQAAGDLEALKERGRRVVRVRLEDVQREAVE